MKDNFGILFVLLLECILTNYFLKVLKKSIFIFFVSEALHVFLFYFFISHFIITYVYMHWNFEGKIERKKYEGKKMKKKKKENEKIDLS